MVRRAVDGKKGWKACLLRWKHRDGGVRFVESNSAPIFGDNGELTGFRGSDHDVTDLKRADERLKEAYAALEEKVRARTLELAGTNDELRMEISERRQAVELIRKSKELSDALNGLNVVIHSTLDIDEIMHRVAREAATALKVDAAMIGLYEGGDFVVRYAHNMPEAFSSGKLTSNELRGIEYAQRASDAVAFSDAFNDPRLNIQFVRDMGIRSVLVSPIVSKGTLLGALAFYGLSRQIVFEDEHIDFSRKLAASVSLALENSRLFRALQQSEYLSASRLMQLQTIYDTAPVGLCFTDSANRYVSINKRLSEINGLPTEQIIGRTFREVIPALAETVEDICNRVIRTGEPLLNIEIRGRTQPHLLEERYYLATYAPVRSNRGDIVGVNTVVQDITERKRTEEALRTSEQRLQALLNSIPDMAWLKDRQGRFIMVNEPFARSSGKPFAELIGRTDFDAWPAGMAARYQADDEEVMRQRATKRVEEPLAVKDGPERWIETIKTCIVNEQSEVVGTAGIARDITERRRMEEEIRHMAQHDALTGLPNRRLFIDILNLEMAQARRHSSKLAVLFLDLDRFKEVNDTLGHEAGDRLLKLVADRLRRAIRESDTVARIGGDEFNLVLSDIGRAEDVSEIAKKIVDSVAKPVVIAGHDLHVTSSIGISVYPDDGLKVDSLLRYADIAMYHAKESGRNTFRFYNSSINVLSLERMKLGGYLVQAIKRGELSVVYQPQIDIRSRSVSHAEALVRWNHPTRGLLQPDQFIPLAEETGFIAEIDEWVLRTVCRQSRTWKDDKDNPFASAICLN